MRKNKRSTVEDCLPVMKELNAGAVNRGFVAGKSATIWNWDSRKTADGKRRSVVRERKEGNVIEPGERMPEPEIWFHDIFRIDGTRYNPVEIKIFKALTGVKKKTFKPFYPFSELNSCSYALFLGKIVNRNTVIK